MKTLVLGFVFLLSVQALAVTQVQRQEIQKICDGIMVSHDGGDLELGAKVQKMKVIENENLTRVHFIWEESFMAPRMCTFEIGLNPLKADESTISCAESF